MGQKGRSGVDGVMIDNMENEDSCKLWCWKNQLCKAVDWDSGSSNCIVFTAANNVFRTNKAAGVTHYIVDRRKKCEPAIAAGADAGNRFCSEHFDVVSNSLLFTAINFPTLSYILS